MGLFSSKKEGGMMDMIRCDEQDYLIWKWRPVGNEVNSTVSTPKMQTFESREIPLILKTMKKSRFTEVHSYRPFKSMNPV